MCAREQMEGSHQEFPDARFVEEFGLRRMFKCRLQQEIIEVAPYTYGFQYQRCAAEHF